MATQSTVKEQAGPGNPPDTPSKPPLVSSSPTKTETPTSTLAASRPLPPPPPPFSDADFVHVPSYSRWFSWNTVHECEVRLLPEFFESRSPSKTPRVYMYYRNSIVKQFRDNPPRKITFTDVRRTLVGDVGSIRRVFDFLEAWGLINYYPSALAKPLKWDDKDGRSLADASLQSPPTIIKDTAKRVCGGCKSICTIACFYCEKYDLTLCARCYVRGNYGRGVHPHSSEFKRVEISEQAKADWTDKETLQLLEAVMHYGDDWRKVAQHVSGRNEKDCIAQFIKLPFGEEFMSYSDSGEIDEKFNEMRDPTDTESGSEGTSPATKRMRLTPLADASNPIMTQAAFLSALAGVDVAKAAARASVSALSEVDSCAGKEADAASISGTTQNEFEKTSLDAVAALDKEELEVEKAISEIGEVKLKEIHDKIVRFEELDLHLEQEKQRLEQIKNMLFADQLNVLLHRSSAQKKDKAQQAMFNRCL